MARNTGVYINGGRYSGTQILRNGQAVNVYSNYKGALMYHTNDDRWGTKFGYTWLKTTARWEYLQWNSNGNRHISQYNRYYYGSRYRHKDGSKYNIRKKTYIYHKKGTTALYPGDQVAFTNKQGFSLGWGNRHIRCDGYYRKGRFYETFNGYVLNYGNTAEHNYRINTK